MLSLCVAALEVFVRRFLAYHWNWSRRLFWGRLGRFRSHPEWSTSAQIVLGFPQIAGQHDRISQYSALGHIQSLEWMEYNVLYVCQCLLSCKLDGSGGQWDEEFCIVTAAVHWALCLVNSLNVHSCFVIVYKYFLFVCTDYIYLYCI